MGQCFFFGFGVLKARTNFHFCLIGGNGFKKFARCLRENKVKKSKTAKIAEKLTSGWRKCVPQVIFPWFWGGVVCIEKWFHQKRHFSKTTHLGMSTGWP